MQRILPGSPLAPPLPLYSVAQTRQIEAAVVAALPPHTLMQRAGLAVARLARALVPHAQQVWVACGPGNNGGDGLEAAIHLHRWGMNPVITWLGNAALDGSGDCGQATLPADARAALARARAAGVAFASQPPAGLTAQDLCIDALLGLGARRPPAGRMADWLAALHASPAPSLAIDLPTGLDADTGCYAIDSIAINQTNTCRSTCFSCPPEAPTRPQKHPQQTPSQPLGSDTAHQWPARRHTLALLTCKPGLLTAQGRDAAGQIWLDDLGVDAAAWLDGPPAAWLNPAPPRITRAHAGHKGLFGDVAVIGGERLSRRGMGMQGAALLAATAALYGGAGRVLLSLLDSPDDANALLAQQPELMLRHLDALDWQPATTAVCGCGGGHAVQEALPLVLARAARLVLDADALNAIAACLALQQQLSDRATRGQTTILTPHPLEAARLLAAMQQPTQSLSAPPSASAVQARRLDAAQQLAARWQCVVVLKGSGTVMAAPGHTPRINPTGNARLATAGTGDVLAGLIGAVWSQMAIAAQSADPGHALNTAWAAACAATYQHGWAADSWPDDGQRLTASRLARRLAV